MSSALVPSDVSRFSGGRAAIAEVELALPSDTPFGPMHGDGASLAGRPALGAVPCDAPSVAAAFGEPAVHAVRGTVLSREAVGPTGHLGVALERRGPVLVEPLLVEPRVDRSGALRAGPGDPVTATWAPERASVIAA